MPKTLIKALLILISSTAIFGCQKKEITKTVPQPIPVETITVHQSNEPRWLEILGTAVGGHEVTIKSEITGVLDKVNYHEGDFVKLGQVLFTIESTSYKANLEEASAKLTSAQIALAKAKNDYERDKLLFQSKAISQKDIDTSYHTFLNAQAQEKVAQATRNLAKINLDKTTIKAPTQGFVSHSFLKPGAIVTANTTDLAHITQHKDLKVEFSPSDTDLNGKFITQDNLVEILYGSKRLQAKLDYISQSIDPSTGTRLLRAKIISPTTIIPGELIKVRLMTELQKNIFKIPQKAIKQLPDGTYAVFILDKETNTAIQQKVLVDKWSGPYWIVTSGLKEGDEVITNQLLKLRNGLVVENFKPQSGNNKKKKE